MAKLKGLQTSVAFTMLELAVYLPITVQSPSGTQPAGV